MDGYSILAGFLLFFLLFIYITWFGFSIKVENEKEQGKEIKINPYDNLPIHRKLIDKKKSEKKEILESINSSGQLEEKTEKQIETIIEAIKRK